MSRAWHDFAARWRQRLRSPIGPARIARYLRRQLAAIAGQPLLANDGLSYPAWIRERVAQRGPLYPARADSALFSILTPVYNTPPRYLRELARSVFAQTFPFQWSIVDDGSTRRDTLDTVEQLRRDPRVVYTPLPSNRGIAGATRAAAEQATGRYLVPVDADDLLYPDALQILAHCLEQAGWPTFAYSDEDKVLDDSQPLNPFFKPPWDPALFINCCYTSHLCAIDRAAALRAGVYTDHQSRGCPDLDTFARLLATGEVPLHVPEILYSWRIHAGSTASFADRSKPYVIDCQKTIWSRHLAATSRNTHFELRTNPLLGHVGMWYAARLPVDPSPVLVQVFAGRSPRQLLSCLDTVLGETPYPNLRLQVIGGPACESALSAVGSRLPSGAIEHIAPRGSRLATMAHALKTLAPETVVISLNDTVAFPQEGWLWEAAGLLELHADAVACAPRLVDRHQTIVSAGEVFGFDDLVGAPDAGRPPTDSGYHALAFCQHSASALPSELFACRAGVLRNLLQTLPPEASRALLGAWLGAAILKNGQRAVYSPYFVAELSHRAASRRFAHRAGFGERLQFLIRHSDLVLADPHYSRFMDLRANRAYQLAPAATRAEHLNALLCVLEGPREFYNLLELRGTGYTQSWAWHQAGSGQKHLPRAA